MVRRGFGFVMVVTLAAAWAFPAAAEMSAGVAKGVITNKKPRVTVNGPVSEGVVDDIHARALVLNDGDKRFVIVTYDLNCLDVGVAPLRVRVEEELGIPPERLILLATHNHNAPIQINPANFDYGEWLAGRMFGLIEEAIANEVGPVRLKFGHDYGYFIEARGNAPVDYEVQMLRVEREGEPMALLFNHGTHPAQASAKKIGPGHPGFAMNEIEKAMPGVHVMYTDAAGGNQFVRRSADFNKQIMKARAKGAAAVNALLEERARHFGHELAKVALRLAKRDDLQDVTGPITSELEILSLPLGDPIPRQEAEKMAEDFPDDLGLVYYPHPDRGTNWVRMLLYWYENNIPFPKTTTDMICTDDTYLIHKEDQAQLERYDYSINDEIPCVYEEVIVSRIGPMAFVAMQGEVCAPIGMRIKDVFRHDTPIMVFAYMGEHNLYIPTRELVRLEAYQSRVLQIQYASPVPWDPSVEDEMVDGVVRMVRDVMAR